MPRRHGPKEAEERLLEKKPRGRRFRRERRFATSPIDSSYEEREASLERTMYASLSRSSRPGIGDELLRRRNSLYRRSNSASVHQVARPKV